MKENIQNLLDKINVAKKYGSEVYAKTKHYQKIYGFEIGVGKEDTHNNEADAFKHTFMQAHLGLIFDEGISKLLGDRHEEDGQKEKQPIIEENMDRWNNLEGRKIAQKIAKQINNPKLTRLYAFNGKLDDLIAKEVMNKMKNGELITNPYTDNRKFEPNQSSRFSEAVKNVYAEIHNPIGEMKLIDHNTLRPINFDNDPNRIITIEELKSMSPQDFVKHEQYIRQQVLSGKVMSQADADKIKQSGSVNSSKPSGSSPKSSGNGSKSGGSSGSSKSSGGSSGGGSASGDEHWVTINGNHVLMND